jgi:hypothetical protein
MIINSYNRTLFHDHLLGRGPPAYRQAGDHADQVAPEFCIFNIIYVQFFPIVKRKKLMKSDNGLS